MDFKLYSHPDILLGDHLAQVSNAGMSRFASNAIFPEHARLLRVILSFHDLGKGSDYFQSYLLKAAPRSNLTRHSEFSALWACYYCMEKLKLDPLDSLFAYVCVMSHHGNLDNFSELLCPDLSRDELKQISEHTNYTELNAIQNSLGLDVCLSASLFEELLSFFAKNSLSSLYRSIRSQIIPEHWLRLNYLFSLLIWADKYSAIFKSQGQDHDANNWNIGYLNHYKNGLPIGQGAIASIRNEAYACLPEYIKAEIKTYSINMPTGSGKTLSSLKVALELQKAYPHLQRIIYSLPFTSVIDQNYKVFVDILQQSSVNVSSDLILAHHHLAEYDYQGIDEYSQNEAEYLVETWDSKLVVTTFVQLLASCLSVRNSSLKRFHRLANAVIILDEVQNIPHCYWELLRSALKQITQSLNSVILLVTATLPMIFDPEDQDVLELAYPKEAWFASLNRVELHRKALSKTIELDELANMIAEDYVQDKSLKRLIILNTIQSSLDLYEMLADLLPDARFLYLSSNVIPKQRLERIDTIKKHTRTGLIIVSTQVVEAGVDIDVDIVYRDLAPLDSIIQASGRCNRNESKGRSRVVLFQLAKNQRPYWRYIYDETLVQGTLRALGTDEAPLEESELHEISTRYYAYLNSVSSKDRSKRIIKGLNTLNLGSALAFHPKNNPDAFNLIDSYPTQTVFIDCDESSAALLESYYALRESAEQDSFEKRAELKKTFRKMGTYMINVDKRFVKSEEPIFIIEKNSLPQYYDPDTGFKRKADQADYIF
ncbi:MAG: CRISPR-associated helicase Cas3' [Candidatus Cloacimonetes bacterium]|nr:CRISPR-associated helicase Cas3' [Candidatus Cloacimonadota bacterium]MDD2229715.1 CRISPR-associated helicase Cas3' [Candidatus Cloacimonadota bacterium]